MNYLLLALTTGLIATVVMDIWGFARKPLLGMPAADYRLVGRWLLYLARGRFRHASIAAASPLKGEVLAGWTGHYLLGLGFAAAWLPLAGDAGHGLGTLLSALMFGLASVLLPALILQPAMGMGRAIRPQSLLTHAVFGCGLYLGVSAATLLSRA